MIDLGISLSDEEVRHILESKNRIARLLRVKKITGLYAKTLYKYLDDNIGDSAFIKCGFCGSIKLFTSFDYKIVGNNLFLCDVNYSKPVMICSRRDTDATLNCKSKMLNPNSKEFVMSAYGFSTEAEANEFILSRNKSPFYRNNHNSDAEYKKSQRRDAEFYGSVDTWKTIKSKIAKRCSKPGLIEAHGLGRAEEICRSKDSSSKEHFKNKYGSDWEVHYNDKKNRCKQDLAAHIRRYGEVVGNIKYAEFIANCADAKNLFNSQLSKEESRLRYDTSSKEYFKRTRGDDWERHYTEKVRKTAVHASKASAESLKFYELLIDKIAWMNLEYYIGVDGNKEWFIYDSDAHKHNFYDFCISSLGIIIEFHGSIWHYNTAYDYTKRDLPYGMTLDEHKKHDQYKTQLAETSGFDYYVVFDTDNYEDLARDLAVVIKDKQNCLQNR